MRRPFVAGNWKMNLTLASSAKLVDELIGHPEACCPGGSGNTELAVQVAVCPPYPYLLALKDRLNGSFVGLGAQNMYCEPSGAFTGEVSAEMLKDVGCRYVIIGHSERRHSIGRGEPDSLLNAKLKAALAAGLEPIFCIGEKIEQRDGGQTENVLEQQIRAGLEGIDGDGAARLVIAYEPVWAIGTGRNATADQAQEAHKFTRALLGELYGEQVASVIPIQYGGSVKPENVGELMVQPDVDGALVGGASLKADSFAAIVAATARAKKLA
ncbi:MAG TPA: triose-phosphate isomerase [Phycisphaerae bacterium]|nr:triose-phosphate isomerase [Phycisphaerae bacterium]